MTTVCQKCGVKGFEDHLIFCNKCQTSVEHRYCLDKIPKVKELEVYWLCEQCDRRVPKVDTFHSIKTRREKWPMRQHHHQSSRADLLKRIKSRHPKSTYTAKSSPNVCKPLYGTSHCLEKDVLNVAAVSKESKSVNVEQGSLLLSSEKNGLHPGRKNHECFSNEVEGRKIKKRRQLILDDDSDEDVPSLMPVDNFTDNVPYSSSTPHLLPQQNYGSGTAQPDSLSTGTAAKCYSSPAIPIVHPVWRGYFNICDGEYGPVAAHLSNRACERVCKTADMLPQILHFERLPRLEAWPKNFTCSAPTDDNIALYFFPGDVRAKTALEQLLDDVIKKDLALKIIVDKAELLVFPSILLPQQCHLFEGKHYLWGVFRAQQEPLPDTHCSRPIEAAGPVDDHQHYSVPEDASTKSTFRLNGEVEGNEDENAFKEPGALDAQVPFVFEEENAPGYEVPDKHLSRFNEVVEEPDGENEEALLRRKALNHVLHDDSPGFVEVVDKLVPRNFDSNVEFNFRGEYEGDVDGSLGACLNLFPLKVEDLGIMAKVRDSSEVDLELGLETVKDRKKYECKPEVEDHMVLIFGRAIC